MTIEAINWFLLTHLLLQISMVCARVPAIIVFGDSSVDAGNNNQISTILRSDFPPYGRDFYSGQPTGRVSNGRIPPDFISEAFGIKPSIPAFLGCIYSARGRRCFCRGGGLGGADGHPRAEELPRARTLHVRGTAEFPAFLDPTYNIKDFATGVCFASAGTGYDNATSDVLSVIPLWKELEYYKEYQKDLRSYLGDDKANEILGEALYLMSIGTNDFLENYYAFPGRSEEYSIEEYQNFLSRIAGNFITELYQLGARKISLGGLPPMGCLPLERTMNLMFESDCVKKYNDVAMSFNDKLQELVEKLNEELVEIQLLLSNPYYILSDIIQNPKSYGFDQAATARCGTGLFEMGYLCAKINPFTCSDANQYVFWDAFHPTERTNGIVADHVFKTCLAQFI